MQSTYIQPVCLITSTCQWTSSELNVC